VDTRKRDLVSTGILLFIAVLSTALLFELFVAGPILLIEGFRDHFSCTLRSSYCFARLFSIFGWFRLGFPACGAVSEPIAFDILFDFPQGYGLSSSCYLDSLSWLLEIRHRWIVTSR
jgi:hypothetical protein